MNRSQILHRQQELKAIFDAARAEGRRADAVQAGRELSAFICEFNPPKKRPGLGSRAGRKQYAIRQAD